jgi:hypothetical protein
MSKGSRGTINWRAFDAAKEKLSIAHSKVAAMRAANDIYALAGLWEEFLTLQQQVFLRLRKAFEHGQSQAWSDAVFNEQRTDEMLKYILHARNANEHGIDNITETSPSQLTIKPKEGTTLSVKHMIVDSRGPAPWVAMDHETMAKAVVSFLPATIKLVRVRDRGIDYDPPTNHLGQRLDATPIIVAELTTSYLARKVTEAENQFKV